MSENTSFFSFAAVCCTAIGLVSAIFVYPDFARADETTVAAPSCSCPDAANRPIKPKFAGLSKPLDEADEIAALRSLQFALTEVADGSSYVWRRSHGRLSGIVKPLRSHKDKSGAVCRTILVVFSGIETSKTTETVACRLPTGVWQLAG